MIGRISGTLISKNPPQVLVDVQGVGYEIDVPMSTFYDLPEVGRGVSLLTHMVVREDAQLLYGFITSEERSAFRELIKVSGVGPRIGLAVLSGLTVDQLVQAVSLQESGLLTRVPGIGKKTAERLILELKGRLGQSVGSALEISSANPLILQTPYWHSATPNARPLRQPKVSPPPLSQRVSSRP